MKNLSLLAIILPGIFCASLVCLSGSAAAESVKSPVVVDAVVASINGKPITLVELGKRLTPPRRISLEDAGRDPEARQTLDVIILERLILEESESRHISASDDEISSYIDEVAKRNGMTRAEFEKALVAQHRTVPEYRDQVTLDILKSKLASAVLQGNVTVSEEEVNEFLKSHPELASGGPGVKLSHILVPIEEHHEAEASARIKEAKAALDNGQPFADVAAKFSKAPDAHEGGNLGFIPERELNEKIFDAIFPLKNGQVSEPVRIGNSFRIFHLEERLTSTTEHNDTVREEARKVLRQQKTESKMMSYFTTDLYKAHAVDKKI